jgi:excisionase family DNA binding protein
MGSLNESSSSPQNHLAPAKLAYSIKEFCFVAGVGRTTVYQAIKAGALVARKSGKRTLIAASDARQWLEALPAFKATKMPK